MTLPDSILKPQSLICVRGLPAIALAAAGVICGLFPCSAVEAPRPNVVFIYADDWGWGDLGCHGHPDIKTPHLDQLAAEGVDFQQFTVCNPVCSASRTAIVTGHFPARYSVHQHFSSHASNVERGMPDWLDPKAPMLPRLFKGAGYRTAHYGKWHLSGGGITNAPHPEQYGYDDAAVYVGNAAHVFDGTPYAEMTQDSSAHDLHAASFLSVAATDHTLKFIRDSGDTPFYINLWLHETHHLVSATDEDKKAYPDTAEPQRTYYAAVTRADRQVGRVLDLLEELGKTKDTLVIFSSDNGPEVTHPNPGDKFYYSVGATGGLRGRKRSLYLGGVGTPFIVRWPGAVPAGRVDKTTPISGVDVFPTLLAAADIPLPDAYVPDGENILPLLRGESFTRAKPIFWEWRGNHTQDANWPVLGMRDQRWGLLIDDLSSEASAKGEGAQRIELYDLLADRAQKNNLAADQPERVVTMIAKIRKWKATLPVDPPVTGGVQGRKSTGPKKQPDRATSFAKKDLNRDDRLTLKEYLHRFPDPEEGKKRFPNFDRDGDGFLSREEFVFPKRR